MKSTSKTYHSRTEKIRAFRKNHTLAETGEKFKITSERVRQILLEKSRRRCRVHNRLYYNKCSYCLALKYKQHIQNLSEPFLLYEVNKEKANKKRDYLSTYRRTCLVEVLHDKWDKSFAEIAKLLDKDYTTITYLYQKNVW